MPINLSVLNGIHSDNIFVPGTGSRPPESMTNRLSAVESSKLDTAGAFMGGYKNKLINGSFDVWQRGTSFSTVGYFADRWTTIDTGASSTGFGVSRADVTGDYTHADTRYALVWARTGGTSISRIEQRIENARTFSGKKATLSFLGWTSGASTNLDVNLAQVFGTGGSPSAEVTLAKQTVLCTSTPTKFTLTFDVGNVDAKTFGTSENDYLAVRFDSVASGAFGYRITQVQLEEGSVATPFESRHIGQELVLCHRYTRPLQFLNGMASATTIVLLSANHTGMRASPTPTLNNVAQVSDMIANYIQSTMNVTVYTNTAEAGIYQLANFTGLTTGRAVMLLSATILVSAEL